MSRSVEQGVGLFKTEVCISSCRLNCQKLKVLNDTGSELDEFEFYAGDSLFEPQLDRLTLALDFLELANASNFGAVRCHKNYAAQLFLAVK